MPDGPVIGKGRSLLSRPLRVDRVARPEHRQIAGRAAGNRLEQQLRRIVRVALDPFLEVSS